MRREPPESLFDASVLFMQACFCLMAGTSFLCAAVAAVVFTGRWVNGG
jgi:hypothetical protein